jgi:hypothetical protein
LEHAARTTTRHRGGHLVGCSVHPIAEVEAGWNSNGTGIGEADDPCPALQAGKTHGIAAYGGGNCSGAIDVSTALTHHGTRQDFDTETFIAHALRAEEFDASEDGTGRGTPLVPVHCFDARQSDVCLYGDKTGPLDTDGFTHAIAFSCKDHGADAGELAPALRGMGHDGSHANGGGQVAVAFTIHGTDKTATVASETDIAGRLRTKPPGSIENSSTTVAMQSMAVRRLTPTECERLQGFPDHFTAITYKGKPVADGPRYKALGNSMAVPVIAWIGRRIQTQIEPEIARCEREAGYFRGIVMSGELSPYCDPTQPGAAVADMTGALVGMTDWEMEAELLQAGEGTKG